MSSSVNGFTGLPAFFQNSSKTVIDELIDYELESSGQIETNGFNDIDLLDNTKDLYAFDEDAFGDLQTENLPDFFTKSSNNFNEDSLNIMNDSIGNISLSTNKEAMNAGPPGLTNSTPVVAPHYSTLFSVSNKNEPNEFKGQLMNENKSIQQSYARAVAPNYNPSLVFTSSSQTTSIPTLFNTNNSKQESLHYVQSPMGDYQIPSRTFSESSQHLPQQYHQQHQHHQEEDRNRKNVLSYFDLNPELMPPSTHQPAFSAKRPLLFNNSVGGYVSTAATSCHSNLQKPSSEFRYPKGKFMSASDCRIKKNSIAREKAILEQQELPAPIYVPLPVWKETKERIKLQMESTRKSFHEKSREWEEKEKVLGHQVRSDIRRPREQLAIPSLSEMDFDTQDLDDGNDLDSEIKTPFSSRLWTMRLAVQRGYEALYTVQELQHLLSSPLISSNIQAHTEIIKEIDHAIALLSQSIGIRTNNNTTSVLQSAMNTMNNSISNDNFSLDGGHVGAILQTTIGKKLMARSLKLLTPPYRWALVPVILAKTLLSPPPEDIHTPSGAVALAVEQKLLKTIVEFLQYSYQYQMEQQQLELIGNTAIFTNILIDNLRQCIKSVMITQMEKSKLRQALISDRTRAEVMHMIVQIGDQVHIYATKQLKEEWIQTREAFMVMLDN